MSAGIGIGQLDSVEDRLARRRRNHALYAEAFAGNECLMTHSAPGKEYNPNYWLTTVQLDVYKRQSYIACNYIPFHKIFTKVAY